MGGQGRIDLGRLLIPRIRHSGSLGDDTRGLFAVRGQVQIGEGIAVPRRQLPGQEQLRARVEVGRHAARAQLQGAQALGHVQGGGRLGQHVHRRALGRQLFVGQGQVFVKHVPAVALLQQVRIQEAPAGQGIIPVEAVIAVHGDAAQVEGALRAHLHDRAVAGLRRAAQARTDIAAQGQIALRLQGEAAAGALIAGGQVIGDGLVDLLRRLPQSGRLGQGPGHEQEGQAHRQGDQQHPPARQTQAAPLQDHEHRVAAQRKQIGRRARARADQRRRARIADQLGPVDDAEHRHGQQGQGGHVNEHRHGAQRRHHDRQQHVQHQAEGRQRRAQQVRVQQKDADALGRRGQGPDIQAAQRQQDDPRQDHGHTGLGRQRLQQAQKQRRAGGGGDQQPCVDLAEHGGQQQQGKAAARQGRQQRVIHPQAEAFRKRA